MGCFCNNPSENLCDSQDCFIYEGKNYDPDFCDGKGGCESNSCFVLPPNWQCRDTMPIPEECCFSMGGGCYVS